jgi:hypothetical protein
VAGGDERVGLIAGALGAMFTANRERDRAGREIEQIADQLQVLERQRRRAEVMGGDEYFVNHRARVLVDAKWIEGGCRIGIE